MIATILPAVGQPAEVHGFPLTEANLTFAKGVAPLARLEPTVEMRIEEPAPRVPHIGLAQGQLNASRTSVPQGNYPPCPESFRPFYQEVGPRFGVPWQVIEAIHQVESGKSCHTNRRSPAGATGPMQFLPSTWRRYQWDCTGDGIADITNAFDAICTGAHYIGTGLTGYSLERSIYSYNHSWSYVNKVLSIAREIGLEY